MATAVPFPGMLCKRNGAVAAASRRRPRVCIAVSLSVLLLLAVAVVLVAALRPHPADATLSAIRLTSLSLSPRTLSLNATMDADLSIHNPSLVASLAHDAGHAEVYYRGALAADAEVPPGTVGAGDAEKLTIRLTVLADRLAAYAPQLYGDVVGGAGDVQLAVRTTIPGMVTVLGVLRRGCGYGVRRHGQRAPAGGAELVVPVSDKVLANSLGLCIQICADIDPKLRDEMIS